MCKHRIVGFIQKQPNCVSNKWILEISWIFVFLNIVDERLIYFFYPRTFVVGIAGLISFFKRKQPRTVQDERNTMK